ncbi:MAG: S8 family serine peptidase [Deltaproteobacteria bacterium]|nr:S8 family serine peptidase [Deltaproteobacteria bacterium]
MDRIRFLVKADAKIGHALSAARTPFGKMALRLSPLLPRSSSIAGFGLTGAQDWFVAETGEDIDPSAAWDSCHGLGDQKQSLAAAAGITYAEPDWPQTWIPTDQTEFVSPFGIVDSCEKERKWMEDSDVPHGDKPDWHLDDDYSGLRSARRAAAADNPRHVRIGHLDTGYDPNHRIRPPSLSEPDDLEHNFVEGENCHSAADPFVSGILKNPGHGTGTIGILAGAKLENLAFPDEDTGDFLGGAYQARIIPVRIASSVLLLYTSALAKGLDYLTAPKKNSDFRCDVVTISMGGLASAAWTEIVNRAYDLGICIFAAAGNNLGGLPTHHIVYPARYRRVTAVCGVMQDGRPYYDLGLDTMAGNFGPDGKMSTAIAAYTPNIPWAKWGCPRAYRWNGEGTSSATPQVAAAAALYIQKHLTAIGNYREGWMRVEAVRKALFDSARKNTRQDWRTYFGNGTLNAAAAMQVQPAKEADLRKQDRDSASFPFLRVLTGVGLAAAPSEMIQLEILQLTQQSPQLQDIIPDPDVPEEQISDRQKQDFFEAILADPKASNTLKENLRRHLTTTVLTVPPAAPPPAPPSAPRPTKSLTTIQADPPYRKLRGYVIDPSLSTELSHVDISETIYKVLWEPALETGPKGEYIEVVDFDYAEDTHYAPVDLNAKNILARDGLAPSEGNAQFHQQMVYAVAMSTIARFEAALGRRMQWADNNGKFVRRLKLFPHAMSDKNAFYSPDRKAILFGYFHSEAKDRAGQYPGGLVYTCLSHDIIAHEVTHALLDGMHKGFREPSNPDVLAFHEAFADMVALFQQFSHAEVVKSQLASVRGALEMESLLGNLARQFGKATTGHAALRSAYLKFTPQGSQRLRPDPSAYQSAMEPHDRGAVLLAAVFGAFIAMYRNRAADLMRLATSGSGILSPGALHPDLVNRLFEEVAKASQHVLGMCIRALDYCPPVDITFGDFLQAVITADHETVPDDPLHYRTAFVESFQKWGIYPRRLQTLSIETLLWRSPQTNQMPALQPIFEFLSRFIAQNGFVATREDLFMQTETCKKELGKKLGLILSDPVISYDLASALGLNPELDYSIARLRFSQKVSPKGDLNPSVIVAVTQKSEVEESAIPFRGGATLVVDLTRSSIRYCITKNMNSVERKDRQLAYTNQLVGSQQFHGEPFAALHLDKTDFPAGSHIPFGRIDPIFGKATPILFAHRGGAKEVAESTRKGFMHAVRVGADVLELDVHALDRNKEGRKREFVVWHGPDLTNVRVGSLEGAKEGRPGERTESENDIRKWNWENLKGNAWVADPDVWLDPNGAEKPLDDIDLSIVQQSDGRLLMTLGEFLEEFPHSHVNIELKDSFSLADIGKFVKLLDRYRNNRIILVVSLNPILIEAFRIRSGNRYPTGFSVLGVGAAWLGEKLPFNSLPDMKKGRALQTTYHPHFTPRGLIRDVQARNGAVHVFLTAFTKIAPAIDAQEGRPTSEELFEILNRGVDGVMTDRPDRVRGLIDAWRKRFVP